MDVAIAKALFLSCFILWTSSPTVNSESLAAGKLDKIFIQQKNGPLNAITNSIANAVQNAVSNAKKLVGCNTNCDLKTALEQLVQDKIETLKQKGTVFKNDNRHMEFNIRPTSTVLLPQLLPLKSSVSLPSIPLRRVTYTFATSKLSVATREYGSQVLIPSVLQLQNVAFLFTVRLQNESSLVLTLTGDFVFGKQTIPVRAVYNHATGITVVKGLVSRITLNFQTVAKKLVGLNLPSALHKSLSVPKLTIAGIVTSSGKSELIASSTRGDVQVYVIYKKAGTASKAIAVELPKVKLASVVKDLFGLSISGTPYFGSAVLPKIALAYTSRNISLPKNIFTQSPLLNNLGHSLPKGFTAFVKFSFSDKTIVKLHYGKGDSEITFNPIVPGSLKLEKLASVIPKFDLSRVDLPPGVKGLLKLSVDKFSVNIKTKGMQVVVSYPGTLKIFKGLLSVKDLKVAIVKEPSQSIDVKVNGDLAISGREFRASFTKNAGMFIVSAEAKRPFAINFQSIAKKLIDINLPKALRKSMTISRLAIRKMVAPGESELIVNSAIGKVQMYIMYKKIDTMPMKVLAIEIPKVKLASVFKDMLGLSISGIPYFGRASIPQIALVYASHDISLPKNTFTNGSLLSNLRDYLPQGFTAIANFFSGETIVKLHYDTGNSEITFNPIVPGSLKLEKLASVIPKFDLSRVDLPPGVKGLLKLSVDKFSVNIKTKGMKVVVSYPGTLKIFKGLLSVNNMKLSISKDPTRGIDVNIDGELVISKRNFQVNFAKKSNMYILSARAKRLPITINFQSIAKKLSGRFNLPKALRKSVNISRLAIKGMMAPKTRELVISSAVGKIQLYIFYKRTGKTLMKAIAIELPKIKLASVLKDMLGLSISGIPFFGSAVLPKIALAYASHDISLPKSAFTKGSLSSNLGDSLKKGFTALIKLPHFPDKLIKLYYHDGRSLFTFTPVIPGSINVKMLASVIGFDPNQVHLPPGISGLLKFSVDTFSLNFKTKDMKLIAGYPGSLKVFNNFLSINNFKLTIVKARTQGRRIKVSFSGALSIKGRTLNVSITQQRGKYILRAHAKQLPISSLIRQFHTRILPSELRFLAPKLPFFKFSIHDLNIVFPFSSKPPQILLQGTPVIRGYKTLRMSSEIVKKGSKSLLVQGFELGDLNLADFLKSITGHNFKRYAMLNLNVQASVIISPATLPHIHLSGSKLKGLPIKRGVSLKAAMKFPPTCSSDAFCAVAQSLLGKNAALHVHGTIASGDSFALFAGVSKINLGRGIVMSHAGVEIQGGRTNSIGIVGLVKLSNPRITLAARIFLSTSGVVLQMTMSGCWNNAFGAKWLDVCSLHASVSVAPPVSLTGLALGGEVRIGYKRCGSRISGAGYVGIDFADPRKNYYYVNIKGRATVGAILRAFCFKSHIPAPLARSGFPHGFLSSFSLFEVRLPHVPLNIPQGYRFKGTINILGLKASADIIIGLPNGIDFKVQLPSINFKNLFRMTASRKDRNRGPFLNALVQLSPRRMVNIEAKGYLSVLGISVETSLKITNTQYIFHIRGRMLHFFEANLRIYAHYGNIQRAHFRVDGSFTNHLYGTLENSIKNTLKRAGRVATSRINAAGRRVKRFRNKLGRARHVYRAGMRRVNDAERHFHAAAAKVRSLIHRVNSICRIRRCGRKRICVPCPKGFTCWKKVWGKCVIWRPKFGRCCKSIPDVICHTRNAGCYALKKPIKAALHVASKIVRHARHTLHVARVGLHSFRVAVRAAQVAVRGAEHTLKAVNAAVSLGLKASQAIANFGISGIISIREISFHVSLAAANSGSFRGSIKGKFLGRKIRFKLRINLHSVGSMIKQLADHIGRGFSSLF